MNSVIQKSYKADTAYSSVSLVEESLKKAKSLASYGAFIHIDEEQALKAAHEADKLSEQGKSLGPLHGMPIVVKDNIHVKGMPNSAGTPALKNFMPGENNPVVESLINAGAIVIGKTNMHELAFGITSNNTGFGPVRNANEKNCIAGGSSGGSAVAVALDIVSMSLGTDTGGSVRIPPALNGICGFRPTLGRYDSRFVTPVSKTRDTVGPIAATVADIALMDNIITGHTEELTPASLNGLRLGVPKEYFYENLASEVSTAMEDTLQKLRDAGVVLVNVDMPGLEDANNNVSFPVALYEFMQQMPTYLKDHNTQVSWEAFVADVASPDVQGVIESQSGDEAIPASVYQQAIDTFRPQLQSIYQKVFDDYNIAALVVPATPLVATPIASSDETVELNGQQLPTFPTFIHNTDPTSNAGLPSLTLPIGKASSLPVGMLLDGCENSDRKLLEIGLAIENLLA